MKNFQKSKSNFFFPLLAAAGVGTFFLLTSCKASPYQSMVVKNFNGDKYLGQWYEIARFDFKHEKDLKNVTANYSKREDGKIRVLNKGYNYVKNEWQESEGKAKWVKSPSEGALKVSFFGPFYSEYNVVMMNPNYENVLIFGESTKYMWILSRNKTIPEEVKREFLDFAKGKGFPIENLVWTKHD